MRVTTTLMIILMGSGCHTTPGKSADSRASEPGSTQEPMAKAPGGREVPEACKGAGRVDRGCYPQGTQLLGVRLKAAADDRSALFQSARLDSVKQDGKIPVAVAVKGALLVPARAGGAAGDLLYSTLNGTASDGSAVPITICDIERDKNDPDMAWYTLQFWNSATSAWENPCGGADEKSVPKAVALAGTWDAGGAHRDSAAEFTFACRSGVVSKCVDWGYKPWQSRGQTSLAPYHQACTRMARADYCGNGKGHTVEATRIDVYDEIGIQKRGGDPMSFEAAWAADGAYCLSRARHDRPADEVLAECRDRFTSGTQKDLGGGDACNWVAKASGPPLLRNRSYARPGSQAVNP